MRSGPIDLRTYRQPLHAFFQRVVRTFVRKQPATIVSTVAFYVFPYSRFGIVCWDTGENSVKVVAEYFYCNRFAWEGILLG